MGTLRDKILAAEDLPREKVQTDEWAPFGVPFVFVRGLTAKGRENYERAMSNDTDGSPNMKAQHVRESFVALTVIDEESGELAFTPEDVEQLGEKSAAVIIKLFNVGRRLSGMTTPEEDEENPSSGDQDDSN